MTTEQEHHHTDAPVPVIEIVAVLNMLWHGPVLTKSNAAREWADAFAACACLGLATTAIQPRTKDAAFGRIWKLTPKGLTYLWRAGQGDQ